MRTHLLALLLIGALVGAGSTGADAASADEAIVHDEAANFEVSLPPEKAGDWDTVKEDPNHKDVKAHFRTDFTGTDPLAFAEVQVIVFPLKKENAARGLDAIAGQWSSAMEGSLANPRDLTEGKTTLGGQDAYFRDSKGDYGPGAAQVTWHVTRMGKFVYVFHVIRTYQAVGDKGLDEEIGKIRDSFKFLKIEEVKADPKAKGGDGPSGPAGAGAAKEKDKGPDPELLARADMKFDHWRFKCVKPEGLLNVPPDKFEESEIANHMVAKMQRTGDQTYLLIRVYAQIEKSQAYTIEQLAETNLKYFKQLYNEKSRLPEEIDKEYKKFPLAKAAIRMKLTGRRTVPETKYWYIAQCKNDRQYEIEIYITGAEGEKAWKNQVDDFMKNFKPFED